MRILVLSWYFPPRNTIAGLRVGKMAAWLAGRGHDVHVLTAADAGDDTSLEVELPDSCITRVAPLEWGPLSVEIEPAEVAARYPRPVALMRSALRDLVYVPDRYVLWLPRALRVGRELVERWRPDVILASGPPNSVLLGAYLLARRTGVKLVLDIRDPWLDNNYVPRSRMRTLLERPLEQRALAAAAGFVTVTEPWTRAYSARFGVPAETVYNGWDPRDFDGIDAAYVPGPGPLVILHAGSIYVGRRDPTPLFAAMRALGLGPDDVRVRFVGADADQVMPLAEANGVAAAVEVRGRVPYHEALAEQMRADVLLLLQWADPSDHANLPGKLFEYLASQRPILDIGYAGGAAARLIHGRKAGLASSDPAEIAHRLAAWVEEKRRTGGVAGTGPEAGAGLTRDSQYAKLEAFLRRVVPTA
jgi:glycosyltransferase involved in cell wall biosynthesis